MGMEGFFMLCKKNQPITLTVFDPNHVQTGVKGALRETKGAAFKIKNLFKLVLKSQGPCNIDCSTVYGEV